MEYRKMFVMVCIAVKMHRKLLTSEWKAGMALSGSSF